MTFSEKLQKVMQDLHLNQKQLSGMIGKSKGSTSQYLSGKQIPSKKAQSAIALSLGLEPDFFEEEENDTVIAEEKLSAGKIKRMLPGEAAAYLGLSIETIRLGLQQGVFPWGYAVRTSENRWTYFINADRFAEIEGVHV